MLYGWMVVEEVIVAGRWSHFCNRCSVGRSPVERSCRPRRSWCCAHRPRLDTRGWRWFPPPQQVPSSLQVLCWSVISFIPIQYARVLPLCALLPDQIIARKTTVTLSSGDRWHSIRYLYVNLKRYSLLARCAAVSIELYLYNYWLASFSFTVIIFSKDLKYISISWWDILLNAAKKNCLLSLFEFFCCRGYEIH